MNNKPKILATILILVLVSLACQGTSRVPSPEAQPTAAVFQPPDLGVSPVDTSGRQEALVSLYEAVIPGVVAIQTDLGSGSGFVYDSKGHIITNFHVVDGAASVEVDFTSGYKAYGTVIGTDLDSDLAVIKVDAPANELKPLALGDSTQLKVGQTVIAIGNPFGLDGTMTVGIVSALGRTMDSERESPTAGFFSAGDIIQTDAAINPGNSGGPLFNLNGEVVGVNRAIRTSFSSSTGDPLNSGIGFAVAINIVKRVAPVIITEGKYDYPYLGMSSMSDLSLPVIEALGLPQYTGAYVTSIVPDSPAEKAGLRAGDEPTSVAGLLGGGDLIIAINGQPVRGFDDLLQYLIYYTSPGDTVTLTVIRDGQEVDLPLTLGSRP
jgi:2-alkenal reductase